tara:strand:- start:12 stop:722 length:711 start_codon:yes stop_codon:yes gene_type:complete
MKYLKNWDNKNWLSSTKYIFEFCKFLNSKVKISDKTQILDIGCGRANIISYLQKKYKFDKKAIGVDIVKNKEIKKNIIFKKIDAIKYLRKTNIPFDIILIKQTIHFFKIKELNKLINLIKKSLAPNGVVLIFSLKINHNELPVFSAMKKKLDKSLVRDKYLIQIIKKKFVKYKMSCFKFKVTISRKEYTDMLRKRYISCLLNLSKKQIKKGIYEINLKFKKKIKFNDVLDCLIYKN